MQTWTRLAGLLATATLLGACSTLGSKLGPDYEQPAVAWLEQWQTSLYGQVETQGQQADLRFWWHLFDDPTLNQLIEEVRLANPSLRIAGLRILESRAQLGIAGSNLYPQIKQLSGSLSAVEQAREGGQDDQFISYQAGFNLGWELDFWGRFRRGIESADAAFFASIASQQDLQILLNAQTADLYFTYRTTEARIEIARKNAALQERSYEITQRLFERGQQSELDLQQAKSQYLATLSSIPQFQIVLTQARNALAVLLGRPPGELPELADVSGQLPELAELKIAELPAQLLMRRPDVRLAAWQIAAQSAQIGIAEADYYPSISLFGSLGWAGNSLSNSRDTLTLAVGPSITWNLFDQGRIANNIRVQDASLQQLIESYQNTVLTAAREIDDAAIGLVKTREQQQIVADSLAAAQRAMELANAQYREGYASFQRVLDTQRAVAAQADRQTSVLGQLISSVIALYKALGGGWTETPIEQLIPEQTRTQMRERSAWGDLLDAPLPAASQLPATADESPVDE